VSLSTISVLFVPLLRHAMVRSVVLLPLILALAVGFSKCRFQILDANELKFMPMEKNKMININNLL